MKKGFTGTYNYIGRYKKARTTKDKGIRHIFEKDGRGRIYEFWVANIAAEGTVRIAKFSVKRYGQNAKKLAEDIRQKWIKELVHFPYNTKKRV
jgi:hypothetical protein